MTGQHLLSMMPSLQLCVFREQQMTLPCWAARWAACAFAGASAAAVMAHTARERPAECLEVPQTSTTTEDDIKSRIHDFRAWAAGLGADMDAVEVRQSPQVRNDWRHTAVTRAFRTCHGSGTGNEGRATCQPAYRAQSEEHCLPFREEAWGYTPQHRRNANMELGAQPICCSSVA